jgi:hypothetical protein
MNLLVFVEFIMMFSIALANLLPHEVKATCHTVQMYEAPTMIDSVPDPTACFGAFEHRCNFSLHVADLYPFWIFEIF